MAVPSCSLDDIDLSALKVSEIVQISGVAKAQLPIGREGLSTIRRDVESFHEIQLRTTIRCGRDFFCRKERKR